ncbi:MAG: hypothetical protein A2148_09420 [Chloroflexi bacterium RBG_16_68_14]|nr:MAG: hypothetical protein A2148_09420 [Chloroflexi bacterium RBG_16_68_14]
MVGDIKCYHCGHISGQVEGTRADRLVIHTFKPRPGYQGPLPQKGQRLRCERCQGPVYLEDLRPVPDELPSVLLPTSGKRSRSSRTKAA